MTMVSVHVWSNSSDPLYPPCLSLSVSVSTCLSVYLSLSLSLSLSPFFLCLLCRLGAAHCVGLALVFCLSPGSAFYCLLYNRVVLWTVYGRCTSVHGLRSCCGDHTRKSINNRLHANMSSTRCCMFVQQWLTCVLEIYTKVHCMIILIPHVPISTVS